MKRRPWTTDELSYLRESYNSKDLGQIALELGRTPAAVSAKASELGIKISRNWTISDDEYIKAHYPTETASSIADHLYRSTDAIMGRAKALGVKKVIRRNDLWTEADDDMLRELYPVESDKELAVKFNRTPAAISMRAKKLHLRKVRKEPKQEIVKPVTVADLPIPCQTCIWREAENSRITRRNMNRYNSYCSFGLYNNRCRSGNPIGDHCPEHTPREVRKKKSEGNK